MGLMDKLKAQAGELAERAQAGVTQGQAKVSEMQAKRRADALLRDLGAAVYAEHQGEERSTERSRLLRDLDRHAAEHGPIATAATAGSAAAWTAATAESGPSSADALLPDPAASQEASAGDAGSTPGAEWPEGGGGAPLTDDLESGADPVGGDQTTGADPSAEQPNSEAHAVTGVAESMPGPAGDNTTPPTV